MKKIMIIGVGWEQVPLVKKAKDMGLCTILIKPSENDYIFGDREYIANPRNLKYIDEIYNLENPDAIIADECDYSMYAVAYLCDKYNLPGPSLKVQAITNNKFLQRKEILGSGINQPKFELCWNIDMAINVAEKIGYPVIVKPVDNRGSIGVASAKDVIELKEIWYNALANSHSRSCIVEEFIDGDIITLEGFIDSKKLNVFAASTKDTYNESQNVAKVLYYPGKLSDEKYEEVKKIGIKVADSIPVVYGFIHIEFMIEKESGKIYFIEIANRGGGVHISNRILPELTGLDLNAEYINLSLGKEVDLDWNESYKNKIIMYFLEPKGNIIAKDIIEDYKDDILAMHIKKNDKIKSVDREGALGRVGVVIIKGRSFGESMEKCKSIEKKLRVGKKEFYFNNA